MNRRFITQSLIFLSRGDSLAFGGCYERFWIGARGF